MNSIFNKITALILSLSILTPSLMAGNTQPTQKDISVLITSSQTPQDKDGSKEIALSIIGAIVATEEIPDLYKLIQTGEEVALNEFRAEYKKWYDIAPEYYKIEEQSCKNAKDFLAAKYKKEIDALWPRRYDMTYAERESRVLAEIKLFTLENIVFDKRRQSVVIDIALKNPEVISDLSIQLMGKTYVEDIATQIAKAIDISGPHAYMGYSVANIRETVVRLLNEVVRTTNRASNAPTLEKRVLAAGKSENLVKVISRTITTLDGQSALYDFLLTLQRRIEKNPEALGIAGVAIVGIGSLFMFSSKASAQNISNSRLALTRELNATLQATPSLLATKVIALRSVYGASLVSSVIYENKDTMLPLLKAQFAAMKRPEVRKFTARICGATPAENKNNFVEAIKNSANIKPSIKTDFLNNGAGR